MLEIASEKYYTLSEVSEILKVSTTWLRKWIKSGRLPAQRIGRPLYVSETGLQQYIENSKVVSETEKDTRKTITVKLDK